MGFFRELFSSSAPVSKLYPQLPHQVAEQIAEDRRSRTIDENLKLAAIDHEEVYFTPTGGSRVSSSDLEILRRKLVSIATDSGFPSERGDLAFDQSAAVALHSTMNLSPSEAAKPGVWEFISCVLFCDIVRWRFPGTEGQSPLERYMAGRRNTFQRLWWRGFVFCEATTDQSYELLSKLGEDEAVQIMERPFLSGSRVLSRVVARELLVAAERHSNLSRRVLIREAQKKMRRIGAFTSFEAVDELSLTSLVRGVFDQIAQSRTG
jgi:hypothetical protein